MVSVVFQVASLFFSLLLLSITPSSVCVNVDMGVTNCSFAVVGVVSGDPAGALVFHLQLLQYLSSASTFSPHPTLVVV